MSLGKKFSEDFNNVFKTPIFPLQVGFIRDFLPDCIKICNVFSDDWIGNLMRILKMCLKQSFSHSGGVLQPILSLTVLSNRHSDSLYVDTSFLQDFT